VADPTTPAQSAQQKPSQADINKFLQADLPLLDQYLTMAQATRQYKLKKALGRKPAVPGILRGEDPLTVQQKEDRRARYLDSIDSLNTMITDLQSGALDTQTKLYDMQEKYLLMIVDAVKTEMTQQASVASSQITGGLKVFEGAIVEGADIMRSFELESNPDAHREWQDKISNALPETKEGWTGQENTQWAFVSELTSSLTALAPNDRYALLGAIRSHFVRIGLPPNSAEEAASSIVRDAGTPPETASKAVQLIKEAEQASESRHALAAENLAMGQALGQWATNRGVGGAAGKIINTYNRLQTAGLLPDAASLQANITAAGTLDPEILGHLKNQLQGMEAQLKALDDPNPPPAIIQQIEKIRTGKHYQNYKKALGPNAQNVPESTLLKNYLEEGRGFARRARRQTDRALKGGGLPLNLQPAYEALGGQPQPQATPIEEEPSEKVRAAIGKLDQVMGDAPLPPPPASTEKGVPGDTGPPKDAGAALTRSDTSKALAAVIPQGEQKASPVSGGEIAVDEPKERKDDAIAQQMRMNKIKEGREKRRQLIKAPTTFSSALQTDLA